METSDLRIALHSGNYNMVRDGANQALNRLAGYLLSHGASVRVYTPIIAEPDFEPTGDIVKIPSLPIPGRSEYRMPMGFFRKAKRDLAEFRPNVVHVSSPDFAGHRALTWARKRSIPVIASVHTRFDTYPRYYNMAFTEPFLTAIMRRFYRRCDAIVAPSESMGQLLREQQPGDRRHRDPEPLVAGRDVEALDGIPGPDQRVVVDRVGPQPDPGPNDRGRGDPRRVALGA